MTKSKYVVAYVGEDACISQQIVESSSERDAIIKYLAKFQDITFTESELLSAEDIEDLIDYCFDYMAISLSVIKV